jgi:hypothetical protein
MIASLTLNFIVTTNAHSKQRFAFYNGYVVT